MTTAENGRRAPLDRTDMRSAAFARHTLPVRGCACLFVPADLYRRHRAEPAERCSHKLRLFPYAGGEDKLADTGSGLNVGSHDCARHFF